MQIVTFGEIIFRLATPVQLGLSQASELEKIERSRPCAGPRRRRSEEEIR